MRGIRHFHDGVNQVKWNNCSPWFVSDFLFIYYFFSRYYQSSSGSGKLKIFDYYAVDLRVAVFVASVYMYEYCVWVACWEKADWFSAEWVFYYFSRLCLKVSVPSITRVGIKGNPIAAALKRHWNPAFEISAVTLTCPVSTALLDAGDKPLSSCPKQ